MSTYEKQIRDLWKTFFDIKRRKPDNPSPSGASISNFNLVTFSTDLANQSSEQEQLFIDFSDQEKTRSIRNEIERICYWESENYTIALEGV